VIGAKQKIQKVSMKKVFIASKAVESVLFQSSAGE
jgi:hypothetical protein